MAHPWLDESRPVYPGTVKEGYLVKSPPLDRRGVKHWRQRWCVFTSTGNEPPCLLYFTDRQAVLTGRMPINRVPLESCSKVERALSHSSRPHVFAVHLPERVFYFSAVSHEEMMAWVDALSSHLKLEPQDSALTPHSRTLVYIISACNSLMSPVPCRKDQIFLVPSCPGLPLLPENAPTLCSHPARRIR
jgi:hypothetical protein